MTFRISKYSYNSWKTVAKDKNLIYFYGFKRDYSFSKLLALAGVIFSTYPAIHLVRKAVRDNKILLSKFEDRKNKQMAFDYMIYSQSHKDSNKRVEGMSLI